MLKISGFVEYLFTYIVAPLVPSCSYDTFLLFINHLGQPFPPHTSENSFRLGLEGLIVSFNGTCDRGN